MANGSRRPVAPVRKMIAAVLGTFATFVILFGAGMKNWSIGALGVALLALSISIVAVTALRGGARTWVTGIGHVHSVSEIPASSQYGRCELQIVIDAPGLPPRSIKVREPRVPVAKWPRPGTMLPIMVAIDDQRHVRIVWDDVPTHAEAWAEMAETADLPAEQFGADPDDELLFEQQAPPWAQRDPDHDFLPPDEDILAVPDEQGDQVDDLDLLLDEPASERPTDRPIVLEGTLVEPPAEPAATPASVPGPRRPQSEPPLDRHDPPDIGGTATRAHDAADAPPSVVQTVGITVLVADLDRSLTFYRDKLGFDELDLGADTAVLSSGGTRLVLRAVPDVPKVNRRDVHINLEVNDIDRVYQQLRSADVQFTYPPRAVNRGSRLEQWAAAFRDPDGHGIALTQWRERTP